MKYREARLAILAILESLPASELPTARIEKRPSGETVAWFGGRGLHLGSATRDGVRRPKNYRDSAVLDALEGETAYRLDKRHLKNEIKKAAAAAEAAK